MFTSTRYWYNIQSTLKAAIHGAVASTSIEISLFLMIFWSIILVKLVIWEHLKNLDNLANLRALLSLFESVNGIFNFLYKENICKFYIIMGLHDISDENVGRMSEILQYLTEMYIRGEEVANLINPNFNPISILAMPLSFKRSVIILDAFALERIFLKAFLNCRPMLFLRMKNMKIIKFFSMNWMSFDS